MAKLRREVLSQWSHLRAIARRIVASACPLAAQIAFDDAFEVSLSNPQTDRAALLQALSLFDEFLTKLGDEEKQYSNLTRRGLGESVVILARQVAALRRKMDAKLSARLERIRRRCEAVRELHLPTATAKDWREIHQRMIHGRAELMLKKKLPRGMTIDDISRNTGIFYVSPRALRKEYTKWSRNPSTDLP